MPARKTKETTEPFGFNIYPSTRTKQKELGVYYGKSATKVVVELIEEDHAKVFGSNDEE